MCDLPAGGVIGVGNIIKDSIRLSKEIRQGQVIKGRRSNSKNAVAIPAEGTQRVKSRGRKLVSEGEEDNTQAFAAGKSNQVASLSFLGVSKEAAHFDREEEGGSAHNANGLDCVGECAIRCKKPREVNCKRDNDRKGGTCFQFADEWGVVLNVGENG